MKSQVYQQVCGACHIMFSLSGRMVERLSPELDPDRTGSKFNTKAKRVPWKVQIILCQRTANLDYFLLNVLASEEFMMSRKAIDLVTVTEIRSGICR